MEDGQSKDRKIEADEAVRRWGDAVYRLALARMGNRTDAEDIVQTVFVRFIVREEGFSDDEHAKAWLLRVAANCCCDVQRSAWSRYRAPLDEEPEEADGEAARWGDLWEAVGSLPVEQRVVVHLFYEEGYRIEEIARIVDAKPATVRVRLHRARRALRRLLGGR